MMLIKVVDPITVKIFPPNMRSNEDKTDVISFGKFVEDLVSMDKRAGANLKAIRSAQEIIKACKSPENGVVKIHSNDFDLLKNIVESPGEGYIPYMAFQLMPFIDAVMNAEKDH